MLEAMLPASKRGASPGPSEGNIIFLLNDFVTDADIIDKGPLAIPVTKGANVKAGSDSRGNFVNLPGGSWSDVITFFNTKLTCAEVEINMTVADVGNTGGIYGACLFDNRPQGSNTNFILWLIYTSASTGYNREFAINSNGTEAHPAIKRLYGLTELVKIKVRIKASGTTVYVNDELVITTTARPTTFNGQYAGIGRHAFSSVNGVMPLIAKLYYFDIRKIS